MPEHVNHLAQLALVQAKLSPADLEDQATRKRKEDAAYSAYNARLYRRMDRVKQWAMKQVRDELEDQFALAIVDLLEKRAMLRLKDEIMQLQQSAHAHEVDVHRGVTKELAWKHFKATDAHRRGAATKNERDPKQAAKPDVFRFWQERERGKHPQLRTEDHFAMEVCRRWPVFTSIGSIKKLSTRWRNEAKAHYKSTKTNQLAGSRTR